MEKRLLMLVVVIILAVLAVVFFISSKPEPFSQDISLVSKEKTHEEEKEINKKETKRQEEDGSLNIPLKNPRERITKKPFGIKIDPQNSPVQPEKFSGYHTGTDFEIFENEIEEEVMIKAICDGEILEKKSVNGYGGAIVQECLHENNPILVLYGHVNINSSSEKKLLEKGDFVAFLSPANSPQSGFERKHLHLGIIKGVGINYRGYVSSKNELENWIDFESILN